MGSNAVAGEWGHTPLPYQWCDPETEVAERALRHRRCCCGRDNGIETFLSDPGIAGPNSEKTGHRAQAQDEETAPESASVDVDKTMLARSLAQMADVHDADVIAPGADSPKSTGWPSMLPTGWLLEVSRTTNAHRQGRAWRCQRRAGRPLAVG